jgi:uncharacterized membrane protein
VTQPVSRPLSARERTVVIALDHVILGFMRHWLLIVNLIFGIYITAPWLAPVLMRTGHESAARAIYLIYSTQCHQLPQRSFFLFGAQPTYSLAEIQAAWQDTNNPIILRQFIGNPQMGWKVAWSDRMVGMYTSIFAAGLVFALVRKRLRPLSLWAFALLILPMVLDGGTHMASDVAGIGKGFRDSNAWLAWLTGSVFPSTFYMGDALGSFNSWMRFLTGTLFGIGVVWLAYPYMETIMRQAGDELETKLRRAGVIA